MLTNTLHALLGLPEVVLPALHTIGRCLILKAFQDRLVFDGDLHEFPSSQIAVHAFFA